MSTPRFVLPGEEIPTDCLPISPKAKGSLKIGPGLCYLPASKTIITTVAGQLCSDSKKHAVWIENSNGRYTPSVGDLVIAQIQRSSGDNYLCTLGSHTAFAVLPHLSFPLATRKSRPQLNTGSLVYARIATSNKYFDPELECVNPSTNKADGLGELKGGMVFRVSSSFARRLTLTEARGGIVVLEEISDKVAFEIAIGRNGKVWINSKAVKTTLSIGRILETIDQDNLSKEDQRSLVRKVFT